MVAVAGVALWPATAWGQLYGRPVAQPFFDFPNWARWSDCRPEALAWGYEVFPDYGPIDCNCGPGSVACDVDFVAHRPSDWYACAEFAPLTLDYQTDLDIASLGLGGPGPLDTGEFRPEFDSGIKATVGRRIFDCYRLEGTYLGLYDWQDSVVVSYTDGTSDEMTFASSFQSAEVNLRYWAAMPPGPFDVSYLVGGRYLRIHELFTFEGTTFDDQQVATDNILTVNTENDMVGVQIGIQGQCLKTTRWWFDFDLKGGIFTNDASVTTVLLATTNGADVTTGGAAGADRTVWMGDISLTWNWQMTPTCAFRIGYQAIFLNGLALAPNNAVANADLLTGSTARLDDSGELAYHGPTIGLVWLR
jgi:hypothetical protein